MTCDPESPARRVPCWMHEATRPACRSLTGIRLDLVFEIERYCGAVDKILLKKATCCCRWWWWSSRRRTWLIPPVRVRGNWSAPAVLIRRA